MKKACISLVTVMILLAGFTLQVAAQASENAFVGKWEITVKGTPDGDAKIEMTFERKSGKLVGSMKSRTNEMKKVDIAESKKSITVFFDAESSEVRIYLEKKSNDELTGSLLDMFDVTGKRIK